MPPSPEVLPAPTEVPPSAAPFFARITGRWRTFAIYATAVVLSFAGVFFAMDLRHADLRVPFDYEGDALFDLMVVKNVVDKGWYLHTDTLGAPAGMSLYDFPGADNIVCAMIKVMALFSSDAVLLVNLFFIFTFPLIALSTLWTTRRFGISWGPALLVSFLYALLPYHFWRGTMHLFFSVYFLMPPTVLVAWWISSGQLLGDYRRVQFSLLLSVLLGCSIVYYPFFACFLLAVAAVMALVRGDRSHAITVGVLIGLISMVLLLNLLPGFVYNQTHGEGPSGKRYPFEAEVSGLRITQLLLPSAGHRDIDLARIRTAYDGTHPLVNENGWVSLGFIGSAGFLMLIAWAVFIRLRPSAALAMERTIDGPSPQPVGFIGLLEDLSVFNVCSVLLATIGGFSSLFAIFISPQIRGYNRICTLIAYFSFLTVAIGLEWIIRRWVHSRAAAIAFAALLVLLGWLGYLDQVGGDAYRNWEGLQKRYHNDARFFTEVQKTVRPRSMIFELPYEAFPEFGFPINKLVEYSLFRPYFHASGLRWSYGVSKGRPGDVWERATAEQPPDQMVRSLHKAGFAGIYIDRSGYADRAAAIETTFAQVLHAKPLSDKEERFAFFPLPAPEGNPPPLTDILPPSPPIWGNGFYYLEALPDGKGTLRWSAADSEFTLLNDSHVSRKVRFQAIFACNQTKPANLEIHSPVLEEKVSIDTNGTPFARMITLPPGRTSIQFHCDAVPPPNTGIETRSLVWCVENISVTNPSTPLPADALLPLPEPTWTGSFYGAEETPDHGTFRWCGADGDLRFRNPSADTRRMHLQGILRTGAEPSSILQVSSPVLKADLPIEAAGTVFTRDVDLPPGETVIHFHCGAAPVEPSASDKRALVWRIEDFKMEDSAKFIAAPAVTGAASLPEVPIEGVPPPEWTAGFYDLESTNNGKTLLRWCSANGDLQIRNNNTDPIRLRFQATLRTAITPSAPLKISGPALKEDLTIEKGGTLVSRVIDAPPGLTTIHFHCDAEAMPLAGTDTRALVWRVDDFKLYEVATAKAAPKAPAAPTPRPLPEAALPQPTWTGSFSNPEYAPDGKTVLHWCGEEGDLRLRNTTQEPHRVRLKAMLRVAAVPSAPLEITGPNLNENLTIAATGTLFIRDVDLVPGNTVIHFHCQAPAATNAPNDTRELIWRVEDFEMLTGDNLPPIELPPLPKPGFADGFSAPEIAADQKTVLIWCGNDGELRLSNDSQKTRRVRLKAMLRVAAVPSAPLEITGPNLNENLTIAATGTLFIRDVDLVPGNTVIHFHCQAPAATNAPGDTRKLVWLVEDFEMFTGDNLPPLDLSPLPKPGFADGFSAPEIAADQKTVLVWCGNDGELRLSNDSQKTRRVHLQATLRTAAVPSAWLQIRSPLLHEDLVIKATGRSFSRTIDLPPGSSAIHFHCDAAPLPASPGDPRSLVWRVENFKLDAVNVPPPSAEQPPPASEWTNGFYAEEKLPDQKGTMRWCARDGEVRFENDTQTIRHVIFEAHVRTAAAAAATLQIQSAVLKEDVALTLSGKAFSHPIDLPPGDTVIHFHCDAEPLAVPANDKRTLVWRVDNFKLEEPSK